MKEKALRYELYVKVNDLKWTYIALSCTSFVSKSNVVKS